MSGLVGGTPGPWRVSPGRYLVMAGERTIICDVIGAECREDAARDAHLIAAAPDLLAACERAAIYELEDPRDVKLIRDAIAKATGVRPRRKR